MIKEGNVLKADEGKKLLYKDSFYSELYLDGQLVNVNGEIKLSPINESEVKEVYPVLIYSDTYYISATDYAGIISELIRQKYSLDDELAIAANARIGKTSGEEEFQNWRQKCKEVAKEICNE